MPTPGSTSLGAYNYKVKKSGLIGSVHVGPSSCRTGAASNTSGSARFAAPILSVDYLATAASRLDSLSQYGGLP